MKKIIFLLLCTVSMYGQTLQNPTFGNTTTNTLKVKANTTSTTATNVSVQETDGSLNKMTPTNLPITQIPVSYIPSAPTVGGHLSGIDGKLNTLNTTKADDSNVVHKTGTESIDGDKTFLQDINIKGSYIRVAGAFPNISGVLPLYLGDAPNTDRSATFYINKPAVLGAGTSIGWHSIGSYSSITQSSTDAAHATFDSRDVLSGAGTWNHFIGFQSRPVFSGVGISTYMAGFAAILSHNGSGTINEGIGLRVNAFSGAGAFTNRYGVYIENLGSGANDYSIYTGTSKSYFGGNVGFGTTLPSSKVSIKDGASGEQLSFERGTGKVRVIQVNNSDDIAFYNSTASIPYLAMKPSGNIGLGTTTPNYNAHVNSATSGSFLQLTSTDTGTSTTDGILIGTGTGGNAQIINRENTRMVFFTNNTERASIEADGTFGVAGLSGSGTRLISANTTGQLVASNTINDIILTGNSTAPTPTAGDNDTSIATTAFVTGAIATADAGYVKTTGNQSISGVKTFSESTGVAVNAVASASYSAILGQTATTSSAIQATTTSSTGAGVLSNIGASGSGFAYVGQNNGTNTFTVNKTGDVVSNTVTLNSVLKLKAYTVATLPTGAVGDMAYVTDALAPTYNTTVVGGGAIRVPVFYNGTNWTAH